MANTQSDLHKYFKVRKNKQDSISRKESAKSKTTLSQNIANHDSSLAPFKDAFQRENQINYLLSAGKEAVCDVSTKVKAKQEIIQEQLLLQEKEEPTDIGAHVANLEYTSTESEPKDVPLTPKRKALDEQGNFRKRKREQLEEKDCNKNSSSGSYTPPLLSSKSSHLLLEEKTKPTAKKRLLLEEKQPDKKSKDKLDPEAIKKELGKCGRLDELRACLLKLNKCEAKLQSFRSQPFRHNQCIKTSPSKINYIDRKALSPRASSYKLVSPLKDQKRTHSQKKNYPFKHSPKKVEDLKLSRFTSLDIEVPVSPAKSPVKVSSPVKSYREHPSSLADSFSSQLYLPYKYQMVKEIFRAVDTVVSLLHNRQEVITYAKLKPAVQQMVRKTFSEKQLGQLKTVFPLAYFFTQEKLKSKNASSFNAISYELTIKPNMNYKEDTPKMSRNLLREFKSSDLECSSQYRKMNSVVLVERRHIFHCALLEILKKHHNQYLQTLDPPITLDGPVRRWHPEFPIEEVPSPTPSPLPQPPDKNTIDTAKDVLGKAQEIFSVNNRMKEAVESAAKMASIPPIKPCASELNSKDKADVAAALKGVSLSLLEKIRAREAQKAAREMTRTPDASRELEMLSRLPEMARLLRGLFVCEKKAALPYEAVTAKIVSSHSASLSQGEAESHLTLLVREIPDWCTLHKVRSGLYIKLEKSRQLQEITDKLNSVIKANT